MSSMQKCLKICELQGVFLEVNPPRILCKIKHVHRKRVVETYMLVNWGHPQRLIAMYLISSPIGIVFPTLSLFWSERVDYNYWLHVVKNWKHACNNMHAPTVSREHVAIFLSKICG